MPQDRMAFRLAGAKHQADWLLKIVHDDATFAALLSD